MSILNKAKNVDKWKNKYFNLLDENLVTEKLNQNKEELLCKTIIRLSVATTGFNKELDPYLLRIRKQLKNGLKSDRLKVELENFSNALMTLDDSVTDDKAVDAGLFFEFLFQHFPNQKNQFQQIEAKFEKKEYPNTQYLLIAINDVIDSIQSITPLDIDETYPRSSLDLIDYKSINTQLQHLVQSAQIPEKFSEEEELLKNKLKNNEAIDIILNDTITLLITIKKDLQSEQLEMTTFLGKLTEQLTELELKATGAHTAVKKRNLLDQSVTLQMLDLQENSKNATQLEPLKSLINNRLNKISQQIQQHQTQEEIERNHLQQELESLSSKITEIEQESNILKNRLASAHYKATHDPLTGLPNRLAYDARLKTEIARFKRYQSPLSLLIWDVDFFKKINDCYGHRAGDKTLILIAKLISHYCRETDFVSRFGGEEFTMLLSDTDTKAALKTANKLRQIIEKTAFNSNGKKISITVSCGITQFTDEDTAGSFFSRADKALYAAKNRGRNQCVIIS